MSQRGIIVSTGMLLLVACAPAQPVRWFPIEPPPPPVSPPARYSHGMAFNSALGVVEMFGGDDNQTWAWDGTAWEMKSLTGPTRRGGAGLAYDSVRNVCVMFGGTDEEGYRDDTWEWDGTSWTQQLVAGPSPRAAHCLAFDPIRGVTVLFGGGDYTTTSGETWEWNGSTWTFRTSQGPGPRASAAMTFDPDRGVIVLHGGQSGTGEMLGDLWEWDGSTWTQRSSAGPGRQWHSMVYDTARHVAVFFGGLDPGQATGDTWEWDGQIWTQRATSGPSARFGHALAYDPIRHETLLFAGTSAWGGLDDTWSWDGTQWTQRNLAPQWAPEPQSAPMTFDSVRGVTVLVGRGQTWEWDGAEWSLRATDGPSQRTGHGLAFDRARGVTVLFGGQTGTTYEYSAETWEWDGTSWTNRTVSGGPSPRRGVGMVFDGSRGVVALFGGYGWINQFERATSDEYWEWNGATWTQRIIANPPWARFWHSMAFDSDRNAVIVYGGATGPLMTQWIDDLWELRGGTWIRVLPSPPGPRIGTKMVYDPNRHVTVQFGGGDSVFYSSRTRDWNGTTWTNWDIPGPEARMDAGMAYDEVRGEIVLFGGWAGNPSQGRWVNDTWILRESCVPYFMRQPVGGSTCAGNPFSLSIEADGGDSREYQWRKDGVPLTEIPGRITGTLTPNLELLETAVVDSGGYDCVVTNGCGTITSSTAPLAVFDYPGDVTCDGDVDLGDLAKLLSNFGRTDAPPRSEGDLNRDGQVDLADLQILLGEFGRTND